MKNSIYLAALLILILVLSCTKSRAQENVSSAHSALTSQCDITANSY